MTTMMMDERQREQRYVEKLLRAVFETPQRCKRFLVALDELRRRSPKRAQLALDQMIESANGSPPAENAIQQMRLAIEEALGGHEDLPEGLVKQIFTLLEKHAPLNGDEEPLGEMQELRRREEMPPALDVEAFSKALREYGVNADEESVKRALGDMPMNALGGSLGGRFAQKRAGGAMDARLATKFPGIEKLEVMTAADRAIDRRREPSTPSASRLGRMFDRFPGLANIGVYGG